MAYKQPSFLIFLSNKSNKGKQKGHRNLRHPCIFISLLSSLTKETRHSIDSINLRVHNHISINLSALNVGMSHEFANREEVTASSKGEDSKRVSACMEGYILLNSSSLAPFVNDPVTLS